MGSKATRKERERGFSLVKRNSSNQLKTALGSQETAQNGSKRLQIGIGSSDLHGAGGTELGARGMGLGAWSWGHGAQSLWHSTKLLEW